MCLFFEFTTNLISLRERPSGDFVARLYLWVMEVWQGCLAATFACVILKMFPIGTIFAVFGHFRILPVNCGTGHARSVQRKKDP